MKICSVKDGVQTFILGLRYIEIHFMDIEIVFFKVFLRKIISTISNSSYTSQIHCRNALRLDPVHLLFGCEKVNEFWKTLKIWLLNNANISLHLDYKTIIFSACSQALTHFIIVAAKYYIYKSKIFIKKLSIEGFERYLKIKFLNEQYIAKIHNKTDTFLKKWSNLHTYMTQI